MAKFAGLDAQVLGISVDHVPCLKAWADSLGGIHYPLLSDFWPHGEVAQEYGMLRADGNTERALFIIDKQGIIRYIDIHDIDTQPDNDELRQALRQVDPEAAAREPKRMPSALPTGGIVMYCTKWCGDCRKARTWLADHKLAYTEVDIYNIEGAVKQVRQWNNGLIITPTFEIDGKIVSDYDEPKLREVLKEKL
jgi:arsenate reductase-like glutaredoxin family protein